MRWFLLFLPWLLMAAEPRLDPVFQRVDLGPAATTEVAFRLTAAPGTTATAVVVDCACLALLTPTPAPVDAAGNLTLRFRASGIRPGVESVLVATSAGATRAELQIAGPGTGDGLGVLRSALTRAQAESLAVWGVVHDLRGQTRNCGCSHGSLGGIGHLAALPGQAATLAPTLSLRWILTGEVDGQRPGVGAALAERGWRIGDPAVVVSATPEAALTSPGVTAVIPTAPIAINHRRILRPVLDRGLVVDLLLVDAHGQIVDHRVLPVDATLADDPAMAARFPDRLTWTIAESAAPSAACAACHPTSHRQWMGGPHAAAWAKLATADRTDACVTCHTTPLAGQTLAPAVHCQACHQGVDAHIASRGTTMTGSTTDCRSCHDAQHDPGFRREAAWAMIRHASEPTPAPR